MVAQPLMVELLIEKKRAENFYGLIGATYFNAMYDDFDNISRNRDYNTNIL